MDGQLQELKEAGYTQRTVFRPAYDSAQEIVRECSECGMHQEQKCYKECNYCGGKYRNRVSHPAGGPCTVLALYGRMLGDFVNGIIYEDKDGNIAIFARDVVGESAEDC